MHKFLGHNTNYTFFDLSVNIFWLSSMFYTKAQQKQNGPLSDEDFLARIADCKKTDGG